MILKKKCCKFQGFSWFSYSKSIPWVSTKNVSGLMNRTRTSRNILLSRFQAFKSIIPLSFWRYFGRWCVRFRQSASVRSEIIAPKALYGQTEITYRVDEKACHDIIYLFIIIITFVWLFGALVRVGAIDYDPQEIFWDLALYGKVFKKCFMSVLARGMVDLTSDPRLDRAKNRFGGTLGRWLRTSDWWS